MNLFGAFSFGSLIKTFIPGLVQFFVLLIYLELAAYWIHEYVGIYEHLLKNPVLFTFIAIPASIFLGVVLNSIVFSGLSDYLLENKHEKDNETFYSFKRSIIDKINERMSKYFDLSEDEKKIFKKIIDPRYFFLHKESLANIMYLRESYWYYLEFQLNTLVAISLGMPAFIASLLVLYNNSIIDLSSLIIITVVLVISWCIYIWLCKRSALFNLDAHRKKELSLLLGTIYFEVDQDDDKKKIKQP